MMTKSLGFGSQRCFTRLYTRVFGTWLWVLYAVLLVGSVSIATAAEQIYEMRSGHSQSKSRLVFDVSAKVKMQVRHLESPPRVLLDFEGAFPVTSFDRSEFNDPRILRLRSTQNDHIYRLVVDLNQSVEAKQFYLPSRFENQERLVLDLVEVNSSEVVPSPESESESQAQAKPPLHIATQIKPKATGKTDAQTSSPSPRVTQPPKSTQDEFIVVIDAGHGGKDHGAPGEKGGEKGLNLKMAKELATIINRKPGYRAVLTRQGDYFIGLRTRQEMASELGADLFVSIHANWFDDKRVNGAAIFTLSRKGARNEISRLIEDPAHQKATGAYIKASFSKIRADEALLYALGDLAMTSQMQESKALANDVIDALKEQKIKLLQDKPYHEEFAVLKNMSIPSILVETGFLSNPRESEKLHSKRYRQKLMQAIGNGIFDYAQSGKDKPLRRANRVRPTWTNYRVKLGDTLTEIAHRYSVTIAELKQVNQRQSDSLFVGEKIKIPPTPALALAR